MSSGVGGPGALPAGADADELDDNHANNNDDSDGLDNGHGGDGDAAAGKANNRRRRTTILPLAATEAVPATALSLAPRPPHWRWARVLNRGRGRLDVRGGGSSRQDRA
jgi:hypothetical protein